ncbi:hypothetical protein LA354_02180 [Ralstonia pickettii]|uniref:hypothetical protein n=1 Tax=Ralstonia TaxID=48736 RepID=UPI0012D8F26C|nr:MULTISPECIES: hypothetical protein [Ralstonia]MBU6524208.1 hypothetical protein [Ralstonia sp. B265]NPT52611.1 hypothetical protein [Ralstonia sp. 3N]UCA14837.1 hypothetical protein LA354_02180 [Ralstonia pickettii]
MRRTQFAVRERGPDRTGGWIECVGGNKTECESRRQRIGENASKGDRQRDCTLHDEIAAYCERRHHDDHGRAVSHNPVLSIVHPNGKRRAQRSAIVGMANSSPSGMERHPCHGG